jgi:hypothetical protein
VHCVRDRAEQPQLPAIASDQPVSAAQPGSPGSRSHLLEGTPGLDGCARAQPSAISGTAELWGQAAHVQTTVPGWVLVAHLCNPSSSGGTDQEDCSSKPDRA